MDLSRIINQQFQELVTKVKQKDPSASLSIRQTTVKVLANNPFETPVADLSVKTRGKEYNYVLVFNEQSQTFRNLPIV